MSISNSFEYVGSESIFAVGVPLSGMGADSVTELKHPKDLGAVTIAQSKEKLRGSRHAGAAIELDGATHVLARNDVAAMLIALLRSPKRRADGVTNGIG